jgi:DNA-binding GntR family transcriptional regulator
MDLAEPVCTTGTIVEKAYGGLKALVMNFQFKPGERLNETEIARRFAISRTPLREALNRLSREGFINTIPNRGFFCRGVDAKEIYDLYTLRSMIETGCVRISAERASREQIDELARFVEASNAERDYGIEDLIELDEAFHERLMRLAGNDEVLAVLRNINERVRFVRCFDIERNRPQLEDEHRAIVRALHSRDAMTCASLLQTHIELRMDKIVAATRDALCRIYPPRGDA